MQHMVCTDNQLSL